jgi:hypothetical protein
MLSSGKPDSFMGGIQGGGSPMDMITQALMQQRAKTGPPGTPGSELMGPPDPMELDETQVGGNPNVGYGDMSGGMAQTPDVQSPMDRIMQLFPMGG